MATEWKSIEYKEVFRALSKDSKMMAGVLKGRLGDMFKGMPSDEQRLYTSSQLLPLIDTTLVCVHKDKTAKSFLDNDMWYFRYEHGYASVGNTFEALLNLSVQSDIDIEVCYRATTAQPPPGWAPSEQRETVQLYIGRHFTMSMVPILGLQQYCFEIKSAAPFTVKCQGCCTRPMGRNHNDPLVVAVNGEPRWVVQGGYIKPYNSA